jgi:DNA-binding transcriptional regulator YdaS (Cro superfamily)
MAMRRTKSGKTSLRQLAKELGVSASYLSQVKCGKRPASAKLQGAIDSYRQGVKQNARSAKHSRGQNGKISRSVVLGEVLELADRHDLGSCAARRGSSTLPFPTSSQFA